MAYFNGFQTVTGATIVATPGRRAHNCNIEIAYADAAGQTQNLILRVNGSTVLRDANGCRLCCGSFVTGQTVNATFSQAITRSVPPQFRALVITRTSGVSGSENPRLGIDIDIR